MTKWFKSDRTPIGQIFIIRLLFYKKWEFTKEIHVFLIDFQKPYESLHRKGLFDILVEFHFPHKLINLILMSE